MKEIVNKVASAGGRVYQVGGSVRDTLLGIEVRDKDYCVTGLNEQGFKNLFPKAKLVGKGFPVFLMAGSEFALARTERRDWETPNRRGFEVFADGNVTIEDDLFRRDFTVNAMAIDMMSGELADPWGGQADLKARVIKAVSSAFSEDPLRVYRAARFAAMLGFMVDENTVKLMQGLKTDLVTLPVERVFGELEKALKAKRPSVFFRVLKKAELLDVHFPEVHRLIGVEQPKESHPEGDVFEHSMQVLDVMASMTPDVALRWAALCHDLGKGITPKELWPKHHGHDKAGAVIAKEMSERLGLPNRWVRYGEVAAREHMKALRWRLMRPGTIVSYMSAVAKTPLGLEGLSLVVKADKSGRQLDSEVIEVKEIPEIDEFVRLGKRMFSEVNGKTISAPPGPIFGQRLHEARARWVRTCLAGS